MVYATVMKIRRSQSLSCAAALALAVTLSGCEMLSTSSTYEDAKSAYDQGQLRIANAHLADILANGEVTPRVRKLQLDVMLAIGDGNRAMAAIDQLPETLLSGDDRRVAIAHAQNLQGAADKTVSLYEAISPEQYSEQDWRMFLWAQRALGENDLFQQGRDTALSRYPNSAHLNALAADHLYDTRRIFDAHGFANAAISNGPDVLEARMVAGRKAIFEGDLELAIEHYTKANEINPTNALPLTNVVGLHLDLGQVEEAGEVLKIAVEQHGDFPFLQWQLARYKLAIDDVQGARAAKERVERVYYDNPEFMLLMAEIEARFGNKGLALDNYRRFVREVGELPEVMEKIAELESVEGKEG